jgi:UDPglucose 6-dehydrogenase
MARISVVGTGYVGLVAGACFADAGNHVICVDADSTKIDALLAGRCPIYEPGLAEMIQHSLKAKRLEFTTDLSHAVADSLVVFIAVGTPQGQDGSADLSAVLGVAERIGQLMDGYRIIVTKSTVPVGTHKKVASVLAAVTSHPFDYVSNPEFMKEGAAIEDFTRPDRVVIGTDNPAVVEIMKQIYSPFMRKRERLLVMDPASAEMTKYASNAMLASRIAFMNEIAQLCEKCGADVEAVRSGVGCDSRIGHAFLFPGAGFGGSCFPKDLSALIHLGRAAGSPVTICEAAYEANRGHRRAFARRVIEYFDEGPKAETVTLAVWGLAFKGRTDDVRESPALIGVRDFLDKGFFVRAHDPEAMPNARAEIGNGQVTYHDDPYDALSGADALVVFTDWQEFRNPDFDLMAQRLNRRVLFDGRNLYDPAHLRRLGFEYHCIGRANTNHWHAACTAQATTAACESTGLAQARA